MSFDSNSSQSWCLGNMNCFSVMKKTLSTFKFEYSLHDKETAAFYFSNGTIVHAKNLENAKYLMQQTLNTTNGNYWASELENNLWEVQYSPAAFSAVSIIVSASSGHEASKIGFKSMLNDCIKLEIIKIV